MPGDRLTWSMCAKIDYLLLNLLLWRPIEVAWQTTSLNAFWNTHADHQLSNLEACSGLSRSKYGGETARHFMYMRNHSLSISLYGPFQTGFSLYKNSLTASFYETFSMQLCVCMQVLKAAFSSCLEMLCIDLNGNADCHIKQTTGRLSTSFKQ